MATASSTPFMQRSASACYCMCSEPVQLLMILALLCCLYRLAIAAAVPSPSDTPELLDRRVFGHAFFSRGPHQPDESKSLSLHAGRLSAILRPGIFGPSLAAGAYHAVLIWATQFASMAGWPFLASRGRDALVENPGAIRWIGRASGVLLISVSATTLCTVSSETLPQSAKLCPSLVITPRAIDLQISGRKPSSGSRSVAPEQWSGCFPAELFASTLLRPISSKAWRSTCLSACVIKPLPGQWRQCRK